MRDMEKLTPTNIVTDGNKVVAKYKYRQVGGIAVDDFSFEDVSIDEVTITQTEDGVRWQYLDRTPVYIRENGIYALDDTQETRVQAYFALSYLDSEGLADMRSK